MKGTMAALAMAVLAGACAKAQAPTGVDAACAFRVDDAAWVEDAVAAWETARRDILRRPAPAAPPTWVLFDADCVHHGAGDGAWRSAPHDGDVKLPDGGAIPPQVASFASPYDEGRQVYFAMALPSIWRAGGVESALTLETLTESVLVHELTHTLQFAAYTPLIDAMSARWGLGDDLNDDAFQDRFGGDPDLAKSIDAERDLLFAAAAAATDAEARALTARAVGLIDARRVARDVGADAQYAEIEDVFLSLEGAAQWTAFAWLTNEDGAGWSREKALPLFRRGGRKWSQDEGLAIFLVVDRLVPGWIERAFADEKPVTALELLREAAAAPAQGLR